MRYEMETKKNNENPKFNEIVLRNWLAKGI